MSQIKETDKAILEKLFGMQSGYVLDFSDHTMEQFFQDQFKINIYDAKYDFDFSSKSKANRLRGIWKAEDDALVGVIIINLTKYIEDNAILHKKEITASEKELIKKANEIGSKLLFLSGFDFNQQSDIDKLKTKAELIKNFNLSKIDDLSVNEKIYLIKVYYSYYEAILVAYYGSGIYFPTSGIDELNDYFKILRNKLIKIINSDDIFSEIKDSKAYQTLIEPITSLYICPEFFDGVWEDFIVPQIINLREEIADKDLFENNLEIHKTDIANALFLEKISGEIEKLNKLQIQKANNFYKKEAPKYKEDFSHIFGKDKEQIIKHEHTYRFENSIQEKDIILNHKYDNGDTNTLYITKKNDDFYYKGKYLNLSKTAEYFQVFSALFAQIPNGGEISYNELSKEIKSRIPKTNSKNDEGMRKFIQSNLTDSNNGFTRYAKIPKREDNGKPLIETIRGSGIRFNNMRG